MYEQSCTWRTDSSGLKYVRLVEGEGQFMCTLDMSGAFEYTPIFSDTLSATLEYGYTDQASTSIKIKDIPGI